MPEVLGHGFRCSSGRKIDSSLSTSKILIIICCILQAFQSTGNVDPNGAQTSTIFDLSN